MCWAALIFAGFFEVVWAIGLKYTQGFTKLWPSLGTIAAMGASMALLGFSLKELPLGTAYAVWTGIGAVGTVLFGIFLFGESAALIRLVCVGLIVLGILGLKIFTPA